VTLVEQSEHSWGDRRPVTLRDVANAAGVSASAASVVLNGARSGTRVSASTRRTVMEAAERMGYHPNSVARSLITGRTHRIGMYSGRARLDSRNAFFAEVLGGIFEKAAEHGTNTMVHTSGGSEAQLLDLVSNRALDGLIVHAGHDDPLVPLLGKLRVPAVAVADQIESIPSILVDDAAGGRLQAQHLATLGHRHAMIKLAPFPYASTMSRIEAFEEAAERFGIRVTRRFDTFAETDAFNTDDLRLLSDGPNRATAIVCWNEFCAERACSWLYSLGISIPGDVAVIGFDGFQRAFLPRFDLTTIRAPWAAVGRTATSILMSLVDGKSVPGLTTLPVEFIRGNTT
jgi:LacI family transcriptional regulator